MSQSQTDDYRKQMEKASNQISEEDMIPRNYMSGLSVTKGIVAGLCGAVGIISAVTVLALLFGHDVWLAPRFIASIILRESAWSSGTMGIISIAVGTVLHLLIGGIYGAIFAYLIPKMPRAFWIVAGIIFGVLTWAIAAVTLPILTPANPIPAVAYTNILIFAHVIYGMMLGAAGAFFGRRASP